MKAEVGHKVMKTADCPAWLRGDANCITLHLTPDEAILFRGLLGGLTRAHVQEALQTSAPVNVKTDVLALPKVPENMVHAVTRLAHELWLHLRGHDVPLIHAEWPRLKKVKREKK